MKKRIMATVLLLAVNCGAASLSPAAERAYDVYVAKIEARLARQHAKPETYLAALTADAGDPQEFERPRMSGSIQVGGGEWRDVAGARSPAASLAPWPTTERPRRSQFGSKNRGSLRWCSMANTRSRPDSPGKTGVQRFAKFALLASRQFRNSARAPPARRPRRWLPLAPQFVLELHPDTRGIANGVRGSIAHTRCPGGTRLAGYTDHCRSAA